MYRVSTKKLLLLEVQLIEYDVIFLYMMKANEFKNVYKSLVQPCPCHISITVIFLEGIAVRHCISTKRR